MTGLTRRSVLGAGAAGLGVLGAGGLAGCAVDVPKAVAERHQDKVLRIGVSSAPSNINPLDSGSEVTRWIAEPCVESLYTYDSELNSVPLLASGEPEISEDGLTWRIPIRDDVTFQNGDPFSAEDVVATLAHVNDLSSGSEWITYFLGYIQKYSAPDSRTVEIGLTRPYGLLRSHLTNLPVEHRDYVKRKDAMMGTGPYRLDKFVPGQTFTFSRYDGYHGEKPYFAGIQYTVFQDPATRLISLRQGKVDVITSVPYPSLARMREDQAFVVHEVSAPSDILFYVGMGHEPFSDENFRRAVAYSMDRRGVMDKVFKGAATVGEGPIGPAELGFLKSVHPYTPEPDLDLAREYLAKSKVEPAFTITIGTNQTSRDIATVMAAGWAKIGVDCRIEQLPGGPWSNKMLDRSYDVLMNVFQSGFTSGPANYLVMAAAHADSVLSFGYDNPKVNQAMDTVWETTDDEERREALEIVNREMAADAAMFPPVYPKLVMATLNSVTGVDDDLLRISRISPQTMRFR